MGGTERGVCDICVTRVCAHARHTNDLNSIGVAESQSWASGQNREKIAPIIGFGPPPTKNVLCSFHRSHREICTRNRPLSETNFLDDFWGQLPQPAPWFYCWFCPIFPGSILARGPKLALCQASELQQMKFLPFCPNFQKILWLLCWAELKHCKRWQCKWSSLSAPKSQRLGRLLAAPPGNRSCAFGCSGLCLRRCAWCWVILFGVCPALLVRICLSWLVLGLQERAKSWAHSSWGTEPLFDLDVDTSAPRGRTLDGGTIWSLGIKVPRGDSSGEGRAAHGPLHPAVNRSLETLMALLFVFLLWSWFCSSGCLYRVFCLWGWYLVWYLALQDSTRVLALFVVLSLFFFCLVGCSSTPCFLFSFSSLSGAGETQTPLGGLGFPLCFFFAGRRTPTSTRIFDPHLHQGSPPRPVFFFRRRRSRGWWLSGVVLGSRVCLSGGLCWVFCLLVVPLHCICKDVGYHSLFSGAWGRESRHFLPIIRPPPPPFLPNGVKDSSSRKGVVFVGNREGRCHCHTLSGRFSPFSKGEMLSVFSFCVFCVWFGVFCRFFTVLLFLGSLFEKIFGSELLFLGVGVGRVFFGAVLPMFLLYCLVFRSRKCLEKILLMSGLVFLGFFLSSFGFFVDVALFFFSFSREKAQVVTGHTPTRTCVAFSCSFFVPPHLFVRPFWPCVLLLGVFLGVPFWAPRVFGILLVLFWGPFSGREAARVFWSFLSVVFVFPFCCVLRLFSHQLEGADPSSYEAYPRVVEPAPRPSEGPGSAVERARLDTGFLGTFSDSLCSAEGHRDPRDHFHAHRRADAKPPSPYPLTRRYLHFSGGGSCSSGFFPLPWREFSRTAPYLCRGEFGQVFLGPKGGNAVRFFSVLSKSPFFPRLAFSRFSSPSWRKFRRLFWVNYVLVASVVCLPVFASVLGLFFAFVSFGPFFSLAFLLALDFCTRFRRLVSWNCVLWIQGFWGGGP